MTKLFSPPGSFPSAQPPPPALETLDAREVDLDVVRELVRAEAALFRAKVSALLPAYAGRWVVFRRGEVVSAHDSEEEAYVAGLSLFGPDGGQVVARVQEIELTLGY